MRLFTSESVTEGHPDKVADRLSDTILDALLRRDPQARVACETMVISQKAIIAGEISDPRLQGPHASDFVTPLIRQAISEIGYDRPEIGFAADEVDVVVLLNQQSPDISQGTSKSWEWREGGSQDELDRLGAGDQGLMFGYATRESDQLMPLPIALAHELAMRLAQVRRTGTLPYLYPDGKTQVTVEYDQGRPRRVTKAVISAHHTKDAVPQQMESDLRQHVLDACGVMSGKHWFEGTELLVNPSGRFEIGGPQGDAGLTGRKIIVDTYGGYARHGGGAFSGKDPTKVDRSGAYFARYVAKNLVAAGLADKCEIQVSYAIGKASPVSLNVETFDTAQVDPAKIDDLVHDPDLFDFRPEAILRNLDLRQPIYVPTSSYGHFGRPEFRWESTAQAHELARAAGLA